MLNYTKEAIERCQSLNKSLAKLPYHVDKLLIGNPKTAAKIKKRVEKALAFIDLALKKEGGIISQGDRLLLQRERIKFGVLKSKL